MFTKGKSPDSPAPNPGQDAIRPAASKPSARVVPSIISSDMIIKGSVESQGEMTIDGKIDGDVTADSLTIGAEGAVTGEIMAQQVVVRGQVKGSIRARKVELEAGAKVYGDIVHTRLSIQNDAIFEGQVKHADDPLKSAGAATSKPAAPATPAPATSSSTSTPSTGTTGTGSGPSSASGFSSVTPSGSLS